MPATLSTGGTVAVRGEPWCIIGVEPFELCSLVSLKGVGAANDGARLSLLSPFDRFVLRSGRRRFRVTTRSRCARRTAMAAAEAHLPQQLWCAARASIDLLPWQLEPALAAVAGRTRLLLADAVGLGKTIQAGLILAELFARGHVERALVLTPPGLRAQWCRELADRFAIAAADLDQPSLVRASAELPLGANPWGSAPVTVSSIDLVKRPEHMAALEQVVFDVLIVDEAHHVTPGSDRGAAVARLARACPWVVLLTATPHSGDERAFAFIQSLGATRRDSLTVFRRSPADVSRPHPRRARLCAVRPTQAEAAMLASTARYTEAIWRDRGRTDESARLVAIVLARRAASSAAALIRTLERRRALLAGERLPAQTSLPWDEADDRDHVEAEALLRAPGLSDAKSEREEIDRLLALAHAAEACASKPAWLTRWLRRTREPVVVFSEYRDTIAALADRIGRDDVAMVHGGLAPSARRISIDRFVGGGARVLLATDAAGEGLNLHTRCRAVVNVELPWNPVRLEQRVGRVDRLGQHRVVHAVHLFHAASIESRVLAQLYRRASRAAADGLSMVGGVTVQDVADCAIGGGPAPRSTTSAMPPAVIDDIARHEAGRLGQCRRLRQLAVAAAHVHSVGPETGLVATAKRRGKRVRALLCVFEATVLDQRERPAGRTIHPVRVVLDPPCTMTRADAAVFAAVLEAASRLRDCAAAAAEARAHDEAARARMAAGRIGARLEALADALRGAPADIFQQALFDNRASRARNARLTLRAARLAHLERRIASTAATAHLHVSDPLRLIAVWPLDE